MADTYLITGANRGIGLEFVRQLVRRGERVIATARRPAEATALQGTGATVFPLDAADPRSIDAFGEAVKGRSIDVLINNAGVSSETKSLALCTSEELQRAFLVNSTGPLLVTRAVMPSLRAGTRRVIVSISSKLASIGSNTGGSSYGYRASKTALNMLMVSLANELKPEGFVSVVMHPGWVKTDMGGAGAPLSPEDAVRGMISVIDGLLPRDTGTFRQYDGAVIPW